MPEYDVFFKEFFRLFLYPFLERFAPELAAKLDLSHPPEFLDKEVPGEKRAKAADLLIRLMGRDGKERLLHLEAQAQRQSYFPKRMHDYHERFRRRHPKSTIESLAVLLYATGKMPAKGHFTEERDGKVYHWFEYDIIALGDMQAREMVALDDPVVHGLMGLFRRSGLDAAELKAASLKVVMRHTEADTPEQEMLVDGLERYLKLSEEDEERYREMTRDREYEEAQEMLMLAEERGIQRGVVQGEQNALLAQLIEKFGEVPEDVENRVRELKSTKEIRPYLKRILTAGTLDEMGLKRNGRNRRAS